MTQKQLNKSIILNKEFNKLDNLITPAPEVFDLPEKILQFGTGALLRGFVDYFINKAINKKLFNGRILAVESTGSGRGDIANRQDGLFTLRVEGIQKGKDVKAYTVCASVSKTLSAKNDWAKILTYAHSKEMDIIISNTTEVGITLTDDKIVDSPPHSFPGKLTAFLYERYQAFKGTAQSGMVIIPCELIVDNGNKLRDIVVALSKLNKLEHEFIQWVEEHNIFCNTLVDRIVPGSPDKDRAEDMYEEIGFEDKLLTVCEPYRLWAIEGNEALKKRLPFHAADPGIIIDLDVTPYRERKLRLLNGTHTIAVGVGHLSGLGNVKDCMNDKYVSKFISNVMHEEVIPGLLVDKQSAINFAEEVMDRFRNPYLNHQLLSITLQYSSKMRMRNVQTFVRYYTKHNTVPPHMSFGFAAYLLFMKAVKEQDGKYFGLANGKEYQINDDQAKYFYEAWRKVNSTSEIKLFVKTIASDMKLWEYDLNGLGNFTDVVSGHLSVMMEKGIKDALPAFMATASANS